MAHGRRFWILGFLCISAGAFAGDIFPSSQQRRAAELIGSTRVSDRARRALKSKMKHHKSDVKRLTLDTVLLNWRGVKSEAMAIAAAPRLDRTVSLGDVDKESAEAFFQLQDELRAKANALVDAANREDPKGTAHAYGDLLDTCATCHAVFRESRDLASTEGR